MNSLAFLCCEGSGLLAFAWILRRARGPEGLPFLVFTGFYVLTTVIGATIIRFDPRLVEALLLGRGMDVRGMPDIEPWLYWGMLNLPLVAAAVGLYLSGPPPRRLGAMALAEATTSVAGYVVVLAGLVLFCTIMMVSEGYSPSPSTLLAVSGNYTIAIAQRTDMLATLGEGFFGVVYMALPSLAYVGLYSAVRTRRPAWIALTASAILATAWFSVVTVQRSILLVFLIFLGLGAFILGLIRIRALALFGAGLFALLTLMQVFIVGAFGTAQSLVQVVLRIGPAFPYYLGLFPDLYPFYGPDWQGTIFGREFTGAAPDYNLLVNSAIFSSTPVQGASPIGAVTSAYAEGGVAYALLICLVVMLILIGVSRFGRRPLLGPLRFALYLQLLTLTYYLTQVPLGQAVWHSYGIKWGVLTLALLWLLDYGVFRPPVLAGPRVAPSPPLQPRASDE